MSLKSAALPQRRQVPLLKIAEKVMDRAQDRGGVRLDRDPVTLAHEVKEKLGHDRDYRRTGRLVAATLMPPGLGLILLAW